MILNCTPICFFLLCFRIICPLSFHCVWEKKIRCFERLKQHFPKFKKVSWKKDSKTFLKDFQIFSKSICQSPYFFSLTWVKKCSQYFNFYQSIFKHEYLDKDVVLLPSLERTNIGYKWHGELNCHHKELQCGRALLDLWKQISQIMFWIWKGIAYLI